VLPAVSAKYNHTPINYNLIGLANALTSVYRFMAALKTDALFCRQGRLTKKGIDTTKEC
jgi:hypothetical protein